MICCSVLSYSWGYKSITEAFKLISQGIPHWLQPQLARWQSLHPDFPLCFLIFHDTQMNLNLIHYYTPLWVLCHCFVQLCVTINTDVVVLLVHQCFAASHHSCSRTRLILVSPCWTFCQRFPLAQLQKYWLSCTWLKCIIYKVSSPGTLELKVIQLWGMMHICSVHKLSIYTIGWRLCFPQR